jgi:hypothetical protein
MSKNPYSRKLNGPTNQTGAKSYRQLNINFANNLMENSGSKYKLNLKNIQNTSKNLKDEPNFDEEIPRAKN